MPVDGGNLLLDARAHATAMEDPIASRYIRRFIGARELIHGEHRWCLWLENLDPADLHRSRFLRERVSACEQWRTAQGLKSPGGDAYKFRATPHLFRPNSARPTRPYVCIPRHFSEARRYATVAYFDPEVICGDANFTADDPDGYLFAIISSSMFIEWQRAVGGRIKSDLRFSATVVWNNLPLPQMTDTVRAAVIAAGSGVIAARDLHPERSLADHYNPLAMDPALVAAHIALDKIVDRAFGAKRLLQTDAERQTLLFRLYVELSDVGSAGEAPLSRVRQRKSTSSSRVAL
jgi:hypothetical protein